MYGRRLSISAGLGLALCLAATGSASAEQTEPTPPTDPTVVVTEAPSPPPQATADTAASAEPKTVDAATQSATSSSEADVPAGDAVVEQTPPSGDPSAEQAAPSGDASAEQAAPSETGEGNADDAATPAAPEPTGESAATPGVATASSVAVAAAAPDNGAAAAVVQVAAASLGQSVTTIVDGLTAQAIAQSLVGSGITISNVVYTGDGTAIGLASGMDAVGISSGVVLSTGSVQVTADSHGGLVGPNEQDGFGVNNGLPGDVDLDTLVTDGYTTGDAAVLEFDFVPTGNQLVFQYIFGSDEYNEFVNQYNDVFAFYVNGVNCATINGSAITIDNVNQSVNSGYYVNNDPSDGAPAHDTELDGFTTVLTCSAPVKANQTNHIKLAIADTRDLQLDTLVLIQQSSFVSPEAPKAYDDAYSTTVDNSLVIVVPGIVGNDTQSPGGGALAAVKVSGPQYGTVVVNADGSFTYTPNPGFSGKDSFTYVVTDVYGQSNLATVTIDVASGEVTPVVTPVVTSGDAPTAGSPQPGSPRAVTPPIAAKKSARATSAAGKPEHLAVTGVDLVPAGSIAVTLLGAGFAMIAAGRRRKV